MRCRENMSNQYLCINDLWHLLLNYGVGQHLRQKWCAAIILPSCETWGETPRQPVSIYNQSENNFGTWLGSPTFRGKSRKKGEGKRGMSLSFVGRGFEQKPPSQGEQALSSQHITGETPTGEGMWLPLDLPELHILSQEWQADGTIRVDVIATAPQVACPSCQKMCVKIHDTRGRTKRDIALREHRVELILQKRRFICFACRKRFTEPDTACGRRRRTTVRLREAIGKQACTQPIEHVAKARGVGSRFVRQCFEGVAVAEIERQGLCLDEQQPLATPRFLGSDEFARRKGHVYETILCDLEVRRVLEVSAGRKLNEVRALLERLNEPDAVEAVSMDMTASFRPAVQLCLPK